MNAPSRNRPSLSADPSRVPSRRARLAAGIAINACGLGIAFGELAQYMTHRL